MISYEEKYLKYKNKYLTLQQHKMTGIFKDNINRIINTNTVMRGGQEGSDKLQTITGALQIITGALQTIASTVQTIHDSVKSSHEPSVIDDNDTILPPYINNNKLLLEVQNAQSRIYSELLKQLEFLDKDSSVKDFSKTTVIENINYSPFILKYKPMEYKVPDKPLIDGLFVIYQGGSSNDEKNIDNNIVSYSYKPQFSYTWQIRTIGELLERIKEHYMKTLITQDDLNKAFEK